MRYVITGAQGFTGRFLVAELLRRDANATIVGTGRSAANTAFFTHTITWKQRAVRAPLTAELREFDARRYEYVPADLTSADDLDTLIGFAQPDVVVHLAGALRDSDPGVLIESNVSGTAALMGAIAKLEHKPLVVIASSGSVIGMPERLPIPEEHRCAPVEPYAMSKLAAEYVSRVLAASTNVPTIWARLFNLAGPGQDERHVCGRFAAQATAIGLGHVGPALEVGDLTPTRDFIDVRDVARALEVLIRRGVPGETYNVGSGCERSVREILTFTLRLAGLEGEVALVERYTRAADVPRAYADISKIAQLGYRAAYPIETTIADVLAYYRVDIAAADDTSRVMSSTSRGGTAIASSQG